MPTKSGYMFRGWSTGNNESVTDETIIKIASAHTLYAQWEEVTKQVEIIFGKKDLTKEEIEMILNEYTSATFTFTIVEGSAAAAGETMVIIKFTEAEEAEGFVRAVQGSKSMGNIVRSIGFAHKYGNSSATLYPSTLIFNLFII